MVSAETSLVLSDDEFGPLDPKKKFYAFNFGDESYGTRFIERKEDLLNESGLVFPVHSDLFEVVFVTQTVLNDLRDDGTSTVPKQAAEPLSESLKKKQETLRERHDEVTRLFREFVRFSPSEAVYRQWIDSNVSVAQSRVNDRYCLFDPKWIHKSLERLDAMKELCNPLDVQRTPKKFFEVLRRIDLAVMELDSLEEHTKRLETLKTGIAALQNLYDAAVKELVPPSETVKKTVVRDEERRAQYIEDLVRRCEESGIELSHSAKEFLLSTPKADCNPLEPLCSTFRLPAHLKPYERTGSFNDLPRLELEKKYIALVEKNRVIGEAIHDLEERLKNLTVEEQKHA